MVDFDGHMSHTDTLTHEHAIWSVFLGFSFMAYGGLGIEKRKNHSEWSGFFASYVIWGNELLCVGWAIKTVGKMFLFSSGSKKHIISEHKLNDILPVAWHWAMENY